MDGDKVKVTVMYRGREMVHRQLGRKQLDRVTEMLGQIATAADMGVVPDRLPGYLPVEGEGGLSAQEMLSKAEQQAQKEAEAE